MKLRFTVELDPVPEDWEHKDPQRVVDQVLLFGDRHQDYILYRVGDVEVVEEAGTEE